MYKLNQICLLCITIFLFNSCNKTKIQTPFLYDESELNQEKNATERFIEHEISKGFLPSQIIWSSDKEDLNGDGINEDIKVVVFDDEFFNPKKVDENGFFKGKIFINNLSQDFIFNWARNSYFFNNGTKFEIIDVDKKDNLKEFKISQMEREEEDPSTITSIFRYFGNNLFTKSTIKSQGYSGGSMKFIDNNKFMIEHSNNPKISGIYSLSKFFIKSIDMKEEAIDTKIPAACPFVYLKSNNKYFYKGEIIRNLIGKKSEANQELDLGTLEKGKVSIRIKEEKNEISYINSIYIKKDGKLYSPKTTNNNLDLIKKNDEKYLVIKKGEYIDFEYNLDSKSKIEIISKGYYIPLDN